MYNPVMVDTANTTTVSLMSETAQKSGNYIIDLYNAMNIWVDKPLPYGPFHLKALVTILLLTVALSYLFRNSRARTIRLVMLFFWLVMVVSEVAEQFVRSSALVDGVLVFDYRWHTFPFQLCATGIWVLPIIIPMKDCRLRDALMMYMSLYSLFGGLLVCFVPTTVFSTALISNVHTMLQHGSQIIVGVLLMVNNRKKLDMRNFLGAVGVFLVLCSMAIAFNEVFYTVMAAYGQNEKINMFYFSPYYNNGMPFIGKVYEMVPWEIYVSLYITVFTLIVLLIYSVAILSCHVADRIRAKLAARKLGGENVQEEREPDSVAAD